METRPESFTYPVRIEVDAPQRFERIQLLLRVLILVALGVIHQSGAGLFGLSYLLLPVVAAVLITHRSSAGYLERDAPWVASLIEWVTGFYAYMLFVTDSFPLDARARAVRVRIDACGTPSVRSALLRLLISLPHFVVLAMVGVASVLLALIAGLGILLNGRYSEGIRSFQQEVIGWAARVFVYHASLVEPFPPLTLSRSARRSDRPAEHVGSA